MSEVENLKHRVCASHSGLVGDTEDVDSLIASVRAEERARFRSLAAKWRTDSVRRQHMDYVNEIEQLSESNQ